MIIELIMHSILCNISFFKSSLNFGEDIHDDSVFLENSFDRIIFVYIQFL